MLLVFKDPADVKLLVYGHNFQIFSNLVSHERGLLTIRVYPLEQSGAVSRHERIWHRNGWSLENIFLEAGSEYAAYSSNSGMESTFMGATLAFSKRKETCVSSEVFIGAQQKLQHQKLFFSCHRICEFDIIVWWNNLPKFSSDWFLSQDLEM